jgi:sec-independent protein translocase protein TatB
MFDVGSFEVILILVMGLIILGPEQLKSVAKFVGKAAHKLTSFVSEVKEDIANEVEDDEIKEFLSSAKSDTYKVMKSINPLDEELEDELLNSKNIKNLKDSNDKYSGFS